MPLDLQPVDDTLDLRPVDESLDLQPVGEPPDAFERFHSAVMSTLSPGEQQRVADTYKAESGLLKGAGKAFQHFAGTLPQGLARTVTVPSQLDYAPTTPGAGFGQPPARTDLLPTPTPPAEIPRTTESLNKRYLDMLRNEDPLYHIGKVATEAAEPTPEEQKDGWFKAGQYVGSAGPMALGPLAPAAFTLSSIGDSVATDYDRIKRENPQIDDNDAADKALTLATEKGAITAATFTVLPKVLRGPLEKYLVAKFGTTAFRNWLAGRAAAGVEGATLMGGQEAGHRAAEGKAPDAETAKAAAGGFLFNILMPWRQGQESARGGEQTPPESPRTEPTTKPPAPVGESPTAPAQPPVNTGIVSVGDAFQKAMEDLTKRSGVPTDDLAAMLEASQKPPSEPPVSETKVGGQDLAQTPSLDKEAATPAASEPAKVEPIGPVYHSSPNEFETFDTSREGSHFGTLEQASNLRKPEKRAPKAYFLKIRNPLRMSDIGVWSDFNNLHAALSRQDAITPQEADAIWSEWQQTDARGWDALKRTLEQKGYDGIVYENEQEGAGDSYIAFRADQIEPASANLPDFGKPTEAVSELAGLKAKAAKILVDQRGFHPDDAAKYADRLAVGGKKGIEGFIADNQVEPPPAKPGRRPFIRARSDGQPDILDAIQELGGIRPPGKEDVGGEYDGWKEAMQSTARLLINRSAKHRPDTIIPELKSLSGDFQRINNADDLYNAIRGAVAEREGLREKGGGRDEQDRRFWEAATNPKNPKGLVKINASDLKVGHKFRLRGPEISNDELEVTHIDPDTLEVTVKDGRKMGVQTLPDGTEIWVQKASAPVETTTPEPPKPGKRLYPSITTEALKRYVAQPEISEDVRTLMRQEIDRRESGESKPNITPQVPTAPKLRPGEKGTGELLQGEDQPFNLSGERGSDAERIAAEKAAAEKRAQQAKETAEKQQQTLPVFQPEKDKIEDFLNKAIEATKPTTGLQSGEVSMGLLRLPVWLTQELAHGSLKVVRAAYRGGKALAQAIEEGIQWLRTEAGKAFNEKEAREWLTQAANEPETPADDWKAIHTERESVTQELADLNAEIDKAGGRRNAPVDLKNRTDAVIAKQKALTAQLRQQPGYVEDVLNQFNAAKDDMAREDLKGELTMIEPDLLNRVYRDMQTRGIIPASQKLPEPFSSLQELTDWLQAHNIESPRRPFMERLDLATRAANAVAGTKDTLGNLFAWSKAFAKAAWENYKHPPTDGHWQTINKDWFLYDTRSGQQARRLQEVINSKVKEPIRRAAITIWIQADGSLPRLLEQHDAVPDKFKPIWEAATKLTVTEKEVANRIRADFADKLDIGKNAGLVEHGRQNYVPTPNWAKAPQVAEGDSTFAMGGALQPKGSAGNPNARLDPRNPFFSYHKSVPTLFDGIMAGGVPRAMDIGKLVAEYHLAFNKALSSRAVIKALMDAKAKDGRPIVILSGRASPMTDSEGQTKGYVVDSRYKGQQAQTVDGRPYQDVNHFAMKDWKFVLTTEDGKPILARADMLIHPDHVNDLKNVLGKQYYDPKTDRYYDSPIRQNVIGRNLLKANRFLKESLVALAPFHISTLAQEGAFWRVNPLPNGYKIDLDNNPIQRGLVRGGVDLGFSDERVEFQEGMGGHGGIWKYFGLGGVANEIGDLTFKKYLPIIKLKAAESAFAFNKKKYGNKLTEEQLFDLSASQANAAFGIQNNRLLGRSPWVRDVMSLTAFAPDFLLSRMKQVGQAFKPYGGAQRRKFFVEAAALYITARAIQALVDPDHDPHWGWRDAFAVTYKGRRYSIRTVLSDVWHLLTDPRSFAYGRISQPVRIGTEALTGKDWRGVNRTGLEQMNDAFMSLVPMSAQGLVPGAHNRDDGLVQALGRSVGVVNRKDTAAMHVRDLASDFNKASKDPAARNWQKQRDQETLPDAVFYNLDRLLEAEDMSGARREYNRLVKEGHKPKTIAERYKNFRPFTGTIERDKAFYNSLSLKDRKLYDRARAEHQQQYERLKKVAPVL